MPWQRTPRGRGITTGGDGGLGGISGLYGYYNSGGIANAGGAGGNGIEFNSNGSLNTITLTVSGTAAGGMSGNYRAGGNGIEFNAGSIANIFLRNSGIATGGNSTGTGNNGTAGNPGGAGGTGGIGGNGIVFESSSNISSIIFSNNGSAIGGSGNGTGGNGGDSDYGVAGAGGAGAVGGNGIGFKSNSSISDLTLTNTGSAAGGNGTGDGGTGGGGIRYYGGNGIGFSSGDSISNVMVTNNGSATGGNGTGNGGAGGVWWGGYGSGSGNSTVGVAGAGGSGIEFSAGGSLSGITLINSGTSTGGGGTGSGGNGIVFNSTGGMSGITLTNIGLAAGGNGGSGGNGIQFSSSGTGSNLTLINYGTINGGNAGSSGNAGSGISSTVDNLTINNWGTITSGSGLNPAAIALNGNNNTINLFGHSTVNGLIKATGSNNLLNFAFSGVTPGQKLGIQNQLAPYLNGLDSSGSALILGVTYIWDPLIIHLNLSVISYVSQAHTSNQQAVGGSLDSLSASSNGSLLALFNSIDTSGNVPDAMEQLSPQRYQIFGDIALSNANFLTQEVDNRLNNLRDGSESDDASGFSGDSCCKNCVGFAKDGKSVQCNEAAAPKRWGFFASADGVFSKIGGNADMQGASFTTAGMIMGIDGRIGEHALAGLLFSYNHTNAGMDQEGSNAQVESYSTGLYGAFHEGGFYTNGLAAYTRNQYTTQRNVVIPGFNQTATGSSSGDQCTVNIDGGYDHHVSDRLTVGPLAGLEYVHLETSNFNESGASAADLTVNGQAVDSLRSRLGARLDYHQQASKGVALAVEFRAAWQHEFLDDSHAIDSSFIEPGMTPFTVMTSKPNRDAALIGAGLNTTITNTLTLFVDYDVQVGQSRYFQQTLKGGIKFSF